MEANTAETAAAASRAHRRSARDEAIVLVQRRVECNRELTSAGEMQGSWIATTAMLIFGACKKGDQHSKQFRECVTAPRPTQEA